MILPVIEPRGDLEIPNNVGPLVVAVFALLSLVWLTVLLRLWTRGCIARCLGWDDATICITMLFGTAFIVATYYDAKLSMSPNSGEPYMIVQIQNWMIAGEMFYVTTVLLFKVSLGLFFLRVTTVPWHQKVIYATMALSTSFGLVFLFVVLFACRPLEGRSDAAKQWWSERCFNLEIMGGMTYTHAAIGSATDLLFVTMPLLILRKSTMPRREKVTVIFILTLAIAGTICSLVRFRYIYQIASDEFNVSEFAMWSILEPGIGIVANCLATLRPLVRRFFTQRSDESQTAATGIKAPGSSSSRVGGSKTSTVHSRNFSYPGPGYRTREGMGIGMEMEDVTPARHTVQPRDDPT